MEPLHQCLLLEEILKEAFIGSNPNLTDLDNDDLKFEIDFRSVYASILQEHLAFNPTQIGIKNPILNGLF
ncbi:hypothetical protein [Flavobacterium sp.]|uniref:hypothetical protein n=1 Tax=Flavobacterium sp. TaxID=239 RepID=UPI0040486BE6